MDFHEMHAFESISLVKITSKKIHVVASFQHLKGDYRKKKKDMKTIIVSPYGFKLSCFFFYKYRIYIYCKQNYVTSRSVL